MPVPGLALVSMQRRRRHRRDATIRMTKTVRIKAAAAIVAVAALTTAASPSSAAAPKPVRSGTITGWGATWPAMFSGDAWACQSNGWSVGANPECAVWLKSGCNPVLAGRNPAVTASIVDIKSLADGTTPRTFDWRAVRYPGFGAGGGVVVQLWRNDCTEIVSSRWRSLDRPHYDNSSWTSRPSTTFSIPPSTKWMTVTTNDTADLTWTLR